MFTSKTYYTAANNDPWNLSKGQMFPLTRFDIRHFKTSHIIDKSPELLITFLSYVFTEIQETTKT